MADLTRKEFLAQLGALGALSLLPQESSEIARPEPPAQMPNIVLLMSDDQSIPDLGAYGNPTIHTPRLDAFAEASMRFNRAYVTSSSCSPSRGSLLTGRSPHATGSSRLHIWTLPEITHVLGLLKARGYHLGAYRKLHQDNYKDAFDFYGDEEVSLDTFFDQRPDDRPFFLWFGANEPHRPYEPGRFDPPHDPKDVVVPDFLPDTPDVRQDLAWYYDQMAVFDADCGTILDLIDQHNLADNTMVVVTADNGMAFPRAKATCYEAGLKVPLLIRWPGQIEEGAVTDELVSFVDLAATWLDAAGLSLPEDLEGQSLLPLLTGAEYDSRDYVFAERNWHDNWLPARAVIGERFKLIQNYRLSTGYIPSLDIQQSLSYRSITKLHQENGLPEPLDWYAKTSQPQQELYDLQDDSGEWTNRADDPQLQDARNQLERALSDWMNRTHDFLPPPLDAYGAWTDVYDDVNPLNGWLDDNT